MSHMSMTSNVRAVPETSDDQAVTWRFVISPRIRLAVIRAIRYCHYERKRSRIRAHLR